MGGLGNQMFQYAAARRLAHHHNTEVVLDCSQLADIRMGDTPRHYELENLSVNARIASRLEVAEMAVRSERLHLRLLVRLRRLAGLGLHPRVVQESHIGFCPEILGLPDNVYLCGYWQSEKHFLDIQDIIRDEFSVKGPMSNENEDLAREISGNNSVAIHFRRGDYISNAKAAAFHGSLSLNYYEKAMTAISKAVETPVFFVFSDDPEWVRNNFKTPYPTRIIASNPPLQAHEDLRLMSLCRHAVIANSSFSWWGAWLIRNPEKIIIAPETWIKHSDIQVVDLIPDSWIKI